MGSSARDCCWRHTLTVSPLRARTTLLLGVAGALVATVLAPASALAAAPDYRYWFAYAQTKVYTSTLPPSGAPRASGSAAPTMSVAAARAEFEGRQIAIRPYAAITDIWIEPSDLTSVDASGNTLSIAAANVSVSKVHYIKVTRPSYGYSRTGYVPDALLPMTLANGERLGWLPSGAPNLAVRGASAGVTRPFYVLFHVPSNASPGVYTGSLTLTARSSAGEETTPVVIPVSLKVHPFSVAGKNLKTAFGFDVGAVKRNTASKTWLGYNPDPGPSASRVPEQTRYAGDQIAGWMRYLAEHRVSPYYMAPAFENKRDDGTMVARDDVLADYLTGGDATTFSGERFNFNSMRLPTDSVTPWLKNPFASSSYTAYATRYYRSVVSELGPLASKAYAYPVDEPPASRMPFVRRYAAFIHRVAPGVKFILTTSASATGGNLVTGVDIYVYRSHFVFRDSGFIRKVQGAGKTLWLYTAKHEWQKYTPGYLLDKPFADSRAQPWFAYRSRAKGLLYYGVNHYAGRDPFVSQLQSFKRNGRTYYANGDASLIYPGYYPRVGMVVEGAPPVGSLRMEALRDGLEDYEYVRLIGIRDGQRTADRYVARIIGPVPARQAGKLQFPPYEKGAYSYESVRRDMATVLSK